MIYALITRFIILCALNYQLIFVSFNPGLTWFKVKYDFVETIDLSVIYTKPQANSTPVASTIRSQRSKSEGCPAVDAAGDSLG
jgi:hypothetical protein